MLHIQIQDFLSVLELFDAIHVPSIEPIICSTRITIDCKDWELALNNTFSLLNYFIFIISTN
jgi:hypothetical protein